MVRRAEGDMVRRAEQSRDVVRRAEQRGDVVCGRAGKIEEVSSAMQTEQLQPHHWHRIRKLYSQYQQKFLAKNTT